VYKDIFKDFITVDLDNLSFNSKSSLSALFLEVVA
jgi:hypothetical protein